MVVVLVLVIDMTMEKFIITKQFFKNIRRFNLKGKTLQFSIKPVPKEENPVTWIKTAIEQIVTMLTTEAELDDRIGITFSAGTFARGPGWLNFRPVQYVTFNDIWEMIEKIFQSNSSGLDTETFCITSTTVRLPTGSRKSIKYNTFEEECVKRRGIITINNKNDNLCLVRALVVAIAYVSNDPDYPKIRRTSSRLQSERTAKLIEDSGIQIDGEAGIKELRQFQNFLKNYVITVYQYGNKGRDVIFEGGNDNDDNVDRKKNKFVTPRETLQCHYITHGSICVLLLLRRLSYTVRAQESSFL